jgi:hypothetical protein
MPIWRQTLPLLAVALVSQTASAQLQCVIPVGCETTSRSGEQLIVVRLMTSASGGVVKGAVAFVPSSGKVESTEIDENGYVHARWSGDVGNGLVRVIASGSVDKMLYVDTIKLGAPATLLLDQRETPHWYQQHQMRTPVLARIRVSPNLACKEVGVVFRTGADGRISPDTAWAERTTADTTLCVATGRWTLGSAVGHQFARATLVNDPSQHVEYEAKSRTLPWIGMGVASTRNMRSFKTTESEKGVAKITRKIKNAAGTDSIEITSDSSLTSVKEVRRQTVLSPVIAVDFPIYLPSQSLRLSVAADIAHPATNWFVGFSILQITSGFEHEDVGYDIHIVGQLSKRDVLQNPVECAARTAKCESRSETRFVGVGMLLAVNAGGVLETLLTALTK